MRKQELHPRTAIINKKQKNLSKKARTDALTWLANTFPKAFDNSVQISPLKLGIMEDILQFADKAAEAGISKSKLREAVVLYTRRLDYLACLKSREARIDLNGTVLTEVSEEEAEHAAAKIKKRIEKGVRNARKLLAEKSQGQTTNTTHYSNAYPSKSAHSTPSTNDDYLPTYPPRATYASSQNAALAQPAKASTVVVKHKATRQYDPDAVARLKEKLGLSRSLEEKKETAE